LLDEVEAVCKLAHPVARGVNRERLPGLEVQDLAQEVRLAVLSSSAKRYDPSLNSSLGGYLHKRLRGAAQDAVRFERRHNARRIPTDGDLGVFAGQDVPPDILAARSELHQILITAMEELPRRWQQVIACHYFAGMTLQETARVMHASESRIAQIKKMAIQKMKAGLADRGIAGVSSALL
jgi:RNA polymerase sigma factor (sigma-70 family)